VRCNLSHLPLSLLSSSFFLLLLLLFSHSFSKFDLRLAAFLYILGVELKERDKLLQGFSEVLHNDPGALESQGGESSKHILVKGVEVADVQKYFLNLAIHQNLFFQLDMIH